MTTPSVALLPAKWRRVAHELRYSPAALPFTAQRLEDCADELEDALAAQRQDGELLALADEINQANGGLIGAAVHHATLKQAETILRTLATERREVEVTDEMVDRAIRHWYGDTESWSSEEWEESREAMAPLLTAALQPSGEKG